MIEKNDFITIKESKLEKESSFTKIKVKGGCVINVKSNFNNTVLPSKSNAESRTSSRTNILYFTLNLVLQISKNASKIENVNLKDSPLLIDLCSNGLLFFKIVVKANSF